MVDIHCHILPGVDDGSESLEVSMEMLRCAALAGVTEIIATPHKRHGTSKKNPNIKSDIDLLREAAAKQNIKLSFGWEFNLLSLEPDRAEAVKNYCLLGSDTLLLELPFDFWPQNWERLIYSIQAQGIRIIIAHPERYAPVQNDPSLLDILAADGCLFQVNASSLLKNHGHRHKVIRHLAKMGRIDFIASDAHSPEDYDDFKKAVTLVQKKNLCPLRAQINLNRKENS